jgi:2-methylaconitate cis-trans-isomerase PrpF
MGSDKYGMQLNGVGGGISSTSKVVIVDESCRSGHDVDYTFGQVDMRSGDVDWSGSCGNLASAVAIFAMDEGMVKNSNPINHNGSTLVKVFQTNLESSLQITVAGQDTPQDHRIPGVEALGRPISVNFMYPRVGKLALLPTGNVRDSLNLSAPPSPKATSSKIEASLVCAANPTIFVRASDMGIENSAFPLADPRQDVARLQAVIQDIRDVGARAMGVRLSDAVSLSVPLRSHLILIPYYINVLYGTKICGCTMCGIYVRTHHIILSLFLSFSRVPSLPPSPSLAHTHKHTHTSQNAYITRTHQIFSNE